MSVPAARSTKSHFLSQVHSAVVWYAVLGLLDFGFSVMAFALGYGEANPVLDFYKQHGLFEIAKIGSTVVVILLGVYLWRLKVVRLVILLADIAMFGLLVFHLVFWIQKVSDSALYRK